MHWVAACWVLAWAAVAMAADVPAPTPPDTLPGWAVQGGGLAGILLLVHRWVESIRQDHREARAAIVAELRELSRLMRER